MEIAPITAWTFQAEIAIPADITPILVQGEQAIADSYAIRRTALKNKVAYTTTLAGARAVVMALRGPGTGEVHRLQDLHRGLFS